MNEILVYSLDLDVDSTILHDLFETLTQDERLRAARFHFQRDRDRFISRRGMLRQILSRHAGETPSRVRFVTNPFGKPALNGSTVCFNATHSSGRGLVAVSEDREVGVDIERINAGFASEQIPERFFSSVEVAALRDLPTDQRTEAFFQCWCRKEAYVKARGYGFSMPLNSFDVSLAPGDPAALLRGGEGWSLEALDVGPDFAGAVAAHGSGWRVTLAPFVPGMQENGDAKDTI